MSCRSLARLSGAVSSTCTPVAPSAVAAASRSLLSTVSGAGAAAVTLPDLPFAYGALEPFISAEIMEIHHTKHHQTYVNNLNALLEKLDSVTAAGDVAGMIALQDAIKFNGGGHVNHAIFWTNLAPAGNGGGGEPTGELAEAINKKWGDFETFKAKFNASTVAVQGSGWGWLGYNPATDDLEIATCANQDPVTTKGLVPLLGVDVWEHAYYLQYKNVRPDYLEAVWEVVNLGNVAERFAEAKST